MFSQLQAVSNTRATIAPAGLSRAHGISSNNHRKDAGEHRQTAAGTLQCRSMAREHLVATPILGQMHRAINVHMRRWLRALVPPANVLDT